MRVALEMIPTSAHMFGIDTPKDLLSYQETISQSTFATSHASHIPSDNAFQCIRFSLVGRISLQARQAKCLTL